MHLGGNRRCVPRKLAEDKPVGYLQAIAFVACASGQSLVVLVSAGKQKTRASSEIANVSKSFQIPQSPHFLTNCFSCQMSKRQNLRCRRVAHALHFCQTQLVTIKVLKTMLTSTRTPSLPSPHAVSRNFSRSTSSLSWSLEQPIAFEFGTT